MDAEDALTAFHAGFHDGPALKIQSHVANKTRRNGPWSCRNGACTVSFCDSAQESGSGGGTARNVLGMRASWAPGQRRS